MPRQRVISDDRASSANTNSICVCKCQQELNSGTVSANVSRASDSFNAAVHSVPSYRQDKAKSVRHMSRCTATVLPGMLIK